MRTIENFDLTLSEMERRVWLVTGASQGFGLCTVKALLKHGYSVAATSRSRESLIRNVGQCDSARFLALEVDLMSDDAIKRAVEETIAHFGGLDVVMNNAGYGLFGTTEELTRDEVLKLFQVNVFAVHSFMKYAMPHFRSRKNGYFLTMSSIGGWTPPPAFGMYGASKAAVASMTEALAEEAAEFGVKTTVVLPGSYPTNFREAMVPSEKKIPEYDMVHQILPQFKLRKLNESPELAAEVFIELAKHPNPPRALFLGKDANQIVEEKLQSMASEIREWKDRALSTVIPE
jgi:NAD(P)-dependent dehydrogenase (short-subunit alcohol dehydrogenase family)